MVLSYMLLAHCLFCYPLLATAYTYNTLLSSTVSLPIPTVLFYLLLPTCLYLRYSTIFYWVHAFTYGSLPPSTGSLPIPMVLYYLLLSHCPSLLYSTFFYWFPAYTYGIYYLLLDPYLYLWYSSIFYWLPVYTYGTLLPSTAFLPIPMVLYYLLLAHCLSLCYSTTSTGSLPIPMVFYYLLLAPCLSLWYYTIFYWPSAYHYGTLLHSSCPLATAYTNDTLLSTTGSLPIPMEPFYLLLPSCLYLWYSLIFNWLHAYNYGIYHLLLDPYLYLWYSSIVYWLPAYTFGTLLPSTAFLPISIVLYYLLLAHCLSHGTLLILLDPWLYQWYSTIFYWHPAYP